MSREFEDANPFWQWMGIHIDEEAAAQGDAVVQALVRPEFAQHQGIVHGGVVSALIDSAGAWAFSLKYGEAVRTINLSVQYLTPIPPDSGRVVASGTIVRAGKRIVVADVEVSTPSGGMAARGQVIYSRARRP